MNKIIVLVVLVFSTSTSARYGAWIAKVDVDGDVIFNHESGFGFVDGVTEMEISEVDGAIYTSDTDSQMTKFYEDGQFVPGWSLPALDEAHGFDINFADRLWIAGVERWDDEGLYEYTSSGDYINGIEDFSPNDAVFENSASELWSISGSPPMRGLHKLTDALSRLFYDPNYWPYSAGSAGDLPSGDFWFLDLGSGSRKVIKVDKNGSEMVRLTNYSFPMDPQTDPISENCWFFEHYDGDVIKVSPSGGEVFRDASFTDVAAIDVNEADGSVWAAANGKGALVHLSAGGDELLALPFEAEMLHLAVDQRDGSCVVISDGNGLGDLNIQPSSVGRIKAMFAGEGPTSGGAGKGVYGEGERDAPIYEHPWYGYPP